MTLGQSGKVKITKRISLAVLAVAPQFGWADTRVLNGVGSNRFGCRPGKDFFRIPLSLMLTTDDMGLIETGRMNDDA